MEETKRPKIISMTDNGVFSDDMVITWRVSQPVNTVLLYSDKDCPIDDSEDCKGIPMDQYYANVIVFPEPVTLTFLLLTQYVFFNAYDVFYYVFSASVSRVIFRATGLYSSRPTCFAYVLARYVIS